MGRLEDLVEQYERHISTPWQRDLAGPQRAVFVVYDKADERRLRARQEHFDIATRRAGHGWLKCDLTDAFAVWMASIDYRDEYFNDPSALSLTLEDGFFSFVVERVRTVLNSSEADENTVVAILGVASLYGFVHLSKVLDAVQNEIKGRLLVFFPGEYEDNNYRLLDARDGWNYLAVPITAHNGGFE